MKPKSFLGQTVCLDLSMSTPYKLKKSLIDIIVSNGGKVSFILNKKCHFLVKNEPSNLDTYKCRSAFRMGIPIVDAAYINDLISSSANLNINKYLIKNKKLSEDILKKGLIPKKIQEKKAKVFIDMSKLTYYTSNDQFVNQFEINYELAKWIVFNEKNGSVCFLFEVQSSKSFPEKPYRLRIEKYDKKLKTSKEVKKCYSQTSLEIMEIFKQSITPFLNEAIYSSGYQLPDLNVGSKLVQTVSWKWTILNNRLLNEKVSSFVDYIWQELAGNIEDLFDNGFKFTLEQIERAECILNEQKELIEKKESSIKVDKKSSEFYKCLNMRKNDAPVINNKKILSEKFYLCQLLKDVVNISESTNWNMRASLEAKYRSIGAYINNVGEENETYKRYKEEIERSSPSSRLINLFEVIRPGESFSEEIGNQKLLFHGSKVENFVGILSRGLLLPHIVVGKFGLERSDVGMLGCGIYFSDSILTSLKYSKPSRSKNTRLIALCDVALGRCKEYTDFEFYLTSPPEGYESTHGIVSTGSRFADSEFVIYNISQCRLRYVLEIHDEKLDGPLKQLEMTSHIETIKNEINKMEIDEEEINELKGSIINETKKTKKTNSGLVTTSETNKEEKCFLTSVHIRARIVDMTCQVSIWQEYFNDSKVPVEASYMFPIEERAAVCGFEAYIGDKHLVGTCKEKKQAHREYNEALKQNKGAYLMDQQSDGVFKVNVGNLPPQSECLIKITYCAELDVQNGSIVFKLPENLAAWQEIDNRHNWVSEQPFFARKWLERLENDSKRSIKFSILMPFEIRSIRCPTHKLKLKSTACQAVGEADLKAKSSSGDFVLVIDIATIHMPRMLVEDNVVVDGKDSETRSRACMVAFYPEFEASPQKDSLVYFLIDCSNSMTESMNNAKRLLITMLNNLTDSTSFNIIRFGSCWHEMSPFPVKFSNATLKKAIDFVVTSKADMGNTDLLSVLNQYMILGSNGGSTTMMENFIVISDGYFSRQEELYPQIVDYFGVKSNGRLFTCGLGKSSNVAALKSLARATNGSCEIFDPALRARWNERVLDLLDKTRQPHAVSNVAIEWQNFVDGESLQAPRKIDAVFSGRRIVAYGFVDNCLQATLKAKISNNLDEASTVVTCPELCVSRGEILHKLTAKALIDDLQFADLVSRSTQEKANIKERIVQLSTQYSISSLYTSFLAIEERAKDHHSSTTTPQVERLLEDVDTLSYMQYDEDKQIDAELTLDLEQLIRSIDYWTLNYNESNVFEEYLYKRSELVMRLIEQEESGVKEKLKSIFMYNRKFHECFFKDEELPHYFNIHHTSRFIPFQQQQQQQQIQSPTRDYMCLDDDFDDEEECCEIESERENKEMSADESRNSGLIKDYEHTKKLPKTKLRRRKSRSSSRSLSRTSSKSRSVSRSRSRTSSKSRSMSRSRSRCKSRSRSKSSVRSTCEPNNSETDDSSASSDSSTSSRGSFKSLTADKDVIMKLKEREESQMAKSCERSSVSRTKEFRDRDRDLEKLSEQIKEKGMYKKALESRNPLASSRGRGAAYVPPAVSTRQGRRNRWDDDGNVQLEGDELFSRNENTIVSSTTGGLFGQSASNTTKFGAQQPKNFVFGATQYTIPSPFDDQPHSRGVLTGRYETGASSHIPSPRERYDPFAEKTPSNLFGFGCQPLPKTPQNSLFSAPPPANTSSLNQQQSGGLFGGIVNLSSNARNSSSLFGQPTASVASSTGSLFSAQPQQMSRPIQPNFSFGHATKSNSHLFNKQAGNESNNMNNNNNVKIVFPSVPFKIPTPPMILDVKNNHDLKVYWQQLFTSFKPTFIVGLIKLLEFDTNGEFNFNVEQIRIQLCIDCQPIINYLDSCGVKSLGISAENEIKSLILSLVVLSSALWSFKARIRESQLEQLEHLIDANPELMNVPVNIYEGMRKLAKYIDKLERKHALICSNLELANSWPQFNRDYVFKSFN